MDMKPGSVFFGNLFAFLRKTVSTGRALKLNNNSDRQTRCHDT